MAFTHQVQTVISDGTQRISSTGSVSPTGASQLDETISNGASDLLVAFTAESTNLKSFHLWSDQDLTIKTNSSSSPQETFNLKANKPVVWLENMANTPIAGDVTALYVSNASGSDASLKALAGWDA